MASETIAAISTAPGVAGVAVVRISGHRALEIADRVFVCRPPPPSSRPSHTVVPGRMRDETGGFGDRALLLIMRAPRSYTGEDVVEIHCHGGLVVPQQVLRTVLLAGAHLAGPGEFTRRAFCNGKIDLTQAEAVMDLVSAQSDRAARMALRQLEGGLSRPLNDLYGILLDAASLLEAGVDFSEYVDSESDESQILSKLRAARQRIASLLEQEREGRRIRFGVRVAIAGDVNTGKSTLFNALLERNRAITNPQPGTTRDVLEDRVVWNGIIVHLYDTAGIRETDCTIEAEGIERAIQCINDADAIIYVIDATRGPRPEDVTWLLRRIEERPDQTVIVVVNKIDERSDCTMISLPESVQMVRISARRGDGLSDLKRVIESSIHTLNTESELYISERHAAHLRRADSCLGEVERLVAGDESLHPPAASLLQSALREIGSITGRHVEKDLLDNIFSRFCVGK
ncbi:tRNA uridine-5-carboxymethylaminomethyl(34) synthesis GTPase MnmE [Thermosphaera sp.]